MMETNAKLYALSLSDYKTYVFAALFVIGNIALPQLCHLIPQGGLMLLPIYFFTLVGAYKFGTNVGLLTAIPCKFILNIFFAVNIEIVKVSINFRRTLSSSIFPSLSRQLFINSTISTELFKIW